MVSSIKNSTKIVAIFMIVLSGIVYFTYNVDTLVAEDAYSIVVLEGDQHFEEQRVVGSALLAGNGTATVVNAPASQAGDLLSADSGVFHVERYQNEGQTSVIDLAEHGSEATARAVDVSDDGSRILYWAHSVESADGPGLYVYDLASAASIYVSSNTSASAASISGDGGYVAYVSAGSVSLLSLEDMSTEQVFSVEEEKDSINELKLNKDGSKLAMLVMEYYKSRVTDIYFYDSEIGGVVKLTDGFVVNRPTTLTTSIDISDDGHYISAAQWVINPLKNNVVIINTQENTVEEVLGVGGEYTYPNAVSNRPIGSTSISGDGNVVAYNLFGSIELGDTVRVYDRQTEQIEYVCGGNFGSCVMQDAALSKSGNTILLLKRDGNEVFEAGAYLYDRGVFPCQDGLCSDPCSGLEATIIGTSEDDILVGTDGVDIVRGLGGNDVIHSLGGDDIICGGDGDDYIDAGQGKDTVYAENGHDTIFGRGGKDILRGGSGDDVIKGGWGSDKIYGNGGYDTIKGGQGDDVIRGGWGNDTINSGDGQDEVYGGNGLDVVNGGDGSDSCTEVELEENCEEPAAPVEDEEEISRDPEEEIEQVAA